MVTSRNRFSLPPALHQGPKKPLMSMNQTLALVASLPCLCLALGVNARWCLFTILCGVMNLLYLSSGRPTSGKLSKGSFTSKDGKLNVRQLNQVWLPQSSCLSIHCHISRAYSSGE